MLKNQKKSVLLLLSIILINLISYGSAQQSFEPYVLEDDEFVWEVTVLDKEALKETLGDNWKNYLVLPPNASIGDVGDRIKIRIVSTNLKMFNCSGINTYAFVFEIEVWEFTSGEFDEKYDYNETYFGVPSAATLNKEFPLILPRPTVDYLNQSDLSNVEVTENGEAVRIKKDCKIIYGYDADEEDLVAGALARQQIYDKEGNLIYELITPNDILIPSIIIIAIIAVISVAYGVYKVKKSHKVLKESIKKANSEIILN